MQPPIAIISTNRNKYSETFIHNHIKLLPARVHLLYGGYLPKYYGEAQSLLAENQGRGWKSWFRPTPQKTDQERHIEGIKAYLKKHQIAAVLAEYGPSGVAMMDICQELDIPLIVHFHGYDAYRNDVLASYGAAYQSLFQKASATIGVSKDMCQQLLRLGADHNKLHYLPYGIDTSLFVAPRVRTSSPLFVACGRFVEKKAPQLSIRAFALVQKKHQDARLIMIGEGALLAACKALVKELNLSHSVEFTGPLSAPEIVNQYHKAFAFVQHSRLSSQNDSEGTPLSILEAGACGLPVVATRHAGIKDVVVESETGFLVDEGDVDTMAAKMLALLDNPPLAQRMGHQAAVHIRRHYSLDHYIDQLWAIIHRAI